MNTFLLYHKERIKSKLYLFISKKMNRFQLPMNQVIYQLKARGYWNDDTRVDALEMFGMFGFWMMKDYYKYAKSIDFYEMDDNILKYAEKSYDHRKVHFVCGDSIEYIKKTEKKYDFVISDTPIDFRKYVENGIPVYLKDMVRITKQKGVIVIGIHSGCLSDVTVYTKRLYEYGDDRIEDIFYVVRNDKMSLAVIVMK